MNEDKNDASIFDPRTIMALVPAAEVIAEAWQIEAKTVIRLYSLAKLDLEVKREAEAAATLAAIAAHQAVVTQVDFTQALATLVSSQAGNMETNLEPFMEKQSAARLIVGNILKVFGQFHLPTIGHILNTFEPLHLTRAAKKYVKKSRIMVIVNALLDAVEG